MIHCKNVPDSIPFFPVFMPLTNDIVGLLKVLDLISWILNLEWLCDLLWENRIWNKWQYFISKSEFKNRWMLMSFSSLFLWLDFENKLRLACWRMRDQMLVEARPVRNQLNEATYLPTTNHRCTHEYHRSLRPDYPLGNPYTCEFKRAYYLKHWDVRLLITNYCSNR